MTSTFTRLSVTAANTDTITTNDTKKKKEKGKKKSKKHKSSKHEEKPSDIPANLTYFVNALLPFTDRAGRISLRVVESAFHDAPFEISTNAQNEAVRMLFYWIINQSQAMHDSSPTGYDAGREETDSSAFASGMNINVHNSINTRTNTLMNNTTTTTNSSGSNE